MKKVFISHSSKDNEWAAHICSLLEQYDIRCFWDERDLDRTKSDWPSELIRSLMESDHVVLLLTRSSCTSPEILNEIANASASGIDIIPVLQDNIPIPLRLMYFIRKYEWIELFEYSEEAGELLLCKRILGEKVKEYSEMAVKVEPNELTQYEADCFEGINNGGYGAGWDKCLIQNGVSGWKTSEIVLETVLYSEFSFSSINMPELDDSYKAYCLRPEILRMKSRGNDRTRWMLAGIYQNNNLYLTLQKTRYSMASFWWSQIRDNPNKQKEMAKKVFDQEEIFFPNSLCLHVILETQDEKLICTRISNNKKNDYGKTIAVTVGEQISEIDFANCTSNNNQFIDQWVKRTMIEEFNIQNKDYEKYVDVSSIRVLALSYEGDIYNFALPVYVRLRMSYEGFITYLNKTNKSIDEFTDVIPLNAKEALEITKAWNNPELRGNYHPSSFLRALLYATYKGANA